MSLLIYYDNDEIAEITTKGHKISINSGEVCLGKVCRVALLDQLGRCFGAADVKSFSLQDGYGAKILVESSVIIQLNKIKEESTSS